MKKVLLVVTLLISAFTFAQEKEQVFEDSNQIINPGNLIDFKVFPNPTQGALTVDFGELTEGATFHISDVLGKLIYSRKITSYDLQKNSFKLDMSSFHDGVYMVLMKTKTASKTIRVVKS